MEPLIEEHQESKVISLKDLAITLIPYSVLSYGGPMAHISMFRQRFVDQLKWINHDQFQEIFVLCQSLPGPTSTQMLIAIGSIMTNSAAGGFVSFLVFSIPSALVLVICGLLLKQENNPDFTMPLIISYTLKGFQAAAIALVGQAAWKLSQPYQGNKIHCIILFLSAALFLIFESTICMISLMIFGAAFYVWYDNSDQYQKQQSKQQDEESNALKEGEGPFGKTALYIYFVFLGLLLALRTFHGSVFSLYTASFYIIGSLIIGGGHVVLPMIMTEFQNLNLMSEEQFWYGFSIVSALPGPLFNLSAYCGAIIDGIVGAIFAWLSLFAPAFFTIFGILPYWKQYRSNPIIQKLLKGIGNITVGFVISATFLLWKSACYKTGVVGYVASTLIGAGSFYLLEIKEQAAPLVIFLGGLFWFILGLLLTY